MLMLRRFMIPVLALSLSSIAIGQAPKASAKSSQTAAPSAAASQDQLDINTATTDQLKALPGVGDAYAKRIVDGRPYASKNQLTMRGIVPQGTYDKIKDQIVAKRVAATTSKPAAKTK